MEDLNLIRKIAWSFAKKTDLQYSELFSEAALQYCEAIKRFDPKKGVKFTTFATVHMKNLLINYCKKEHLLQSRIADADPHESGDAFQAPEPPIDFHKVIADWPEKVQTLIHMILDNPEMYLGATPNFRRKHLGQYRRLQKVKKDLREDGWEDTEIDATVQELLFLLNSI